MAHHGWYDLATLGVLVAGAIATAFLGLMTVVVGGLAAWIAWRANETSKATAAREQARLDLAERREFATLARAYLRALPIVWEARAKGETPDPHKPMYLELSELAFSLSPPNDDASRLIARINDLDKLLESFPYDGAHIQMLLEPIRRVRFAIIEWVADPKGWAQRDLADRVAATRPE